MVLVVVVVVGRRGRIGEVRLRAEEVPRLVGHGIGGRRRAGGVVHLVYLVHLGHRGEEHGGGGSVEIRVDVLHGGEELRYWLAMDRAEGVGFKRGDILLPFVPREWLSDGTFDSGMISDRQIGGEKRQHRFGDGR